MNQTLKRSFALFMVVVMCITILPIFQLSVDAAVDNKVNYKYSGNYLYNWGKREEVATFLSPMALDFYDKYNITYEDMASYSGGTGQNNVPNSEMYKELQALMKKAHSHITNYNETRPLYQYTDCENNGNVISSFYSGVAIGPAWDGGATWNREHTWPNSKGEGDSENDIMMLRPTSMRENSSRGNKAYGKSSGYYFPNSESNGSHDLRGDVARIFLYVYVRWGNSTNLGNAWGSSGVMESPEVLFEWMEIDPVDTWELGRNDSVQTITGTRNVFVDYPELAFILFSEDIPSNMSTPSGMAKEGKPNTPPNDEECNHIYANDCDTTCDLCGYVRTVRNHVYSGDCDTDCNICGNKRTGGNHKYDYYCDSTCNNCGEKREANHLYIGWEIIKEATDDEPGLEKGKCFYCNEVDEREIPKLNDCSHIYSFACDNTCNKCNKEREATHIYAGWIVIKEATADELGLEKGTCVHCKTESEREIPKLNAPNDGDSDNPPKDEDSDVPPQDDVDDSGKQDEPKGFFEKIAQFFRELFQKIASLFKKEK